MKNRRSAAEQGLRHLLAVLLLASWMLLAVAHRTAAQGRPGAPAANAVSNAMGARQTPAASPIVVAAEPPNSAADVGAPSLTEQRATVVVKVAGYDAARGQIVERLAALGADLVGTWNGLDGKGRRHGWVRVSLPADQMAEAIGIVRASGMVFGERVDTTAETSECESIARRVEQLRAHEGRLAGILANERRLRGSDILFVQDRLFRAGVDEALLEQRRADILRDSQRSILTAELFEPTPTRVVDRERLDVAGHWERGRAHAMAAVDAVRARALTASAYAAVFAPVWIPFLLIAIYLVYRLVRFGRPLILMAVRVGGTVCRTVATEVGATIVRWRATRSLAGVVRPIGPEVHAASPDASASAAPATAAME
jgi:hypothetical protein